MIQLEGRLEHITYHNPHNHYMVARLSVGQSRKNVTVIGVLPGVAPGQNLSLNGTWETHPKYGEQFKVHSFEVTLPETIDGIRAYLESEYIKGIGPLMADRLITHFGADTLNVIEAAPEKLMEIKGIGREKAALIATSWKEQHVARKIMLFLQQHGVSVSHCADMLSLYGEDTLDILQTDPFRLADDLPGKGFVIADTITRHSGVPADDPGRVRACLVHLVKQSATEGHVFIPENALISRGQQLFGISPDIAETALEALVDRRELVVEAPGTKPDGRAVFLQELHTAETGIVNRLKAMLSVPVSPSNTEPEYITHQVLNRLAIKPSAEQLSVLCALFAHRTAIITGGPGTGKTTLIRSITAVLENENKSYHLAAPTGRAARRLAEITTRDAWTIHRLLGYNFRENAFEKDRDDPLDADAVIIDEASMVDTALLYHLLNAMPVTAVLILVGDVFQLPSVGPGNVLDDLIRSGKIPVFYLSNIFRQVRESPIIKNAHMIRNGEMPDLDGDDTRPQTLSEFYFIEQSHPDQVLETIISLCGKSVPERFGFDPVTDIQVLTPMHKGIVGTINLNRILQDELNPRQPGMLSSEGGRFRTHDKVMHLKNNYQKDVFNGDIGTIIDVDRQTGELRVDYYGRTVAYSTDEAGELTLAYAISVHKSQGSEYPAVILPLMTQHYPMLQRNLLYTAITRGQRLVIVLGTKKAFRIALNRENTGQRFSLLDARLKHRINSD